MSDPTYLRRADDQRGLLWGDLVVAEVAGVPPPWLIAEARATVAAIVLANRAAIVRLVDLLIAVNGCLQGEALPGVSLEDVRGTPRPDPCDPKGHG
jgi:hypothetical protein